MKLIETVKTIRALEIVEHDDFFPLEEDILSLSAKTSFRSYSTRLFTENISTVKHQPEEVAKICGMPRMKVKNHL